METMTDQINKLAQSFIENANDPATVRRDRLSDCHKGDLVELDNGRMMIFLEQCGEKFTALDKKTNVKYYVPNARLLRIAQGGHRPEVGEDWQSSLNSGDLFYIFRQGRCELYQVTEVTPTYLECIVPHTDEQVRIRRGEHQGRKINGSLE